ncbi:hypothetical protein SHELI_v1c11380 [Spiroplasma helicoides]|uniref:Uncharacterized protein n=1 Tax=Spiroplasma helicoides TaxID=216938 RepID=A0A1B3SMC7_9MOLU|nr:hypothetical protein [Spiroplasma helicoides]AOG61085.1 hypothetical protein SHELI_v1c11380 [Spiroplasma helicoides]
MSKDFDSRCFKCVEEMQKGKQGGAASILAGKMQQGLAGQDLDSIYVCPKHS